MNFNEAIIKVSEFLQTIGVHINANNYDGIAVKKLEASNTLDEGRTTNQTHIAITGQQMDIFPYLRAEGYFGQDYNSQDDELKNILLVKYQYGLLNRISII